MKQAGKRKRRSLFYRVSAWLHLWLGLATGIIVILLSVTGAILTFEDELRLLFQPYQKVQDHGAPFLPPSALAAAVKNAYHLPGVSAVIYRGRDRSAVVPWYGDRDNYRVNYIDPYTGKALYSQPLSTDFYRIMVEGHYQLWLPREIGQPVVCYATLIFVITLITGLVLWWPKKWTKATRKQGFSVKWGASFKRLNYDLHNVLGFYALLVALVLGLTGMVFGIQWFSKTVYWTASGGARQNSVRPVSDTLLTLSSTVPDEDILFANVPEVSSKLAANVITFGYPYGKSGAWAVAINPSTGTRYREQTIYFEQHSLKLLKEEPTFSQANGGEKMMRMNHDLHVGAVGGIITKIIAFLVCIISASLPVTGFIIWLAKK